MADFTKVLRRTGPIEKSKTGQCIWESLTANGASELEQLQYGAILLDLAEQHGLGLVRNIVDQLAGALVELRDGKSEETNG